MAEHEAKPGRAAPQGRDLCLTQSPGRRYNETQLKLRCYKLTRPVGVVSLGKGPGGGPREHVLDYCPR